MLWLALRPLLVPGGPDCAVNGVCEIWLAAPRGALDANPFLLDFNLTFVWSGEEELWWQQWRRRLEADDEAPVYMNIDRSIDRSYLSVDLSVHPNVSRPSIDRSGRPSAARVSHWARPPRNRTVFFYSVDTSVGCTPTHPRMLYFLLTASDFRFPVGLSRRDGQ